MDYYLYFMEGATDAHRVSKAALYTGNDVTYEVFSATKQ